MVVISSKTYDDICSFIANFNGLSIDCEHALKQKFSDCDSLTVSAILSKEWQKHIRYHHANVVSHSKDLLKDYHLQAESSSEPTILLQIAQRERYSPVSLCRILLNEIYPDERKTLLSKWLKNPHLIPDHTLAMNVTLCLVNDNSDGPLTDMIRRMIGEDYEQRLKKLACDAGMHFHDEVYLRRYGYDKTPDLKLAVPCLYRGKVIYWIESKASFGDLESHQRYIQDQLASYGNRFGAGIVIYWLGYLDKIADCPENDDFILVTDHFPDKSGFTCLNFTHFSV